MRLQRDGSRVLATPPLGGTILPGITRESILQLTRSWGEQEVGEVQERPVTIAEVRQVGAVGRGKGWAGLGWAVGVWP